MNYPTQNIGYITGDGIGRDCTPSALKVLDAGRKKHHGDQAKLNFIKLFAGQEALKAGLGGLPQETLDAIPDTFFTIKGPMATMENRSYNVQLRKELDLYACVRPFKYYPGVPSTHMNPSNINGVLFRENIEDVYSGIEFASKSEEAQEIIQLLTKYGYSMDQAAAIGIKYVTQAATDRLINAAGNYAEEHGYEKLTVMDKGNIMKLTEGKFRNHAYDKIDTDFPSFMTDRANRMMNNAEKGLSIEENARALNREKYDFITGDKQKELHQEVENTINRYKNSDRQNLKIMNHLIADNALQQAFLDPGQFGVIGAMNLNGDYMSDALAAVVGGLGVSPGANINFETGDMVVEATHGTASNLARNLANPSSEILSGKLGMELKGEKEVAKIIDDAMAEQFLSGRLTGDLIMSADKILTGVTSRKAKNPSKMNDYLLLAATEQRKGLVQLTTEEFTNEVCERIAA